jgi:hypothetical protein
MKVAACAAASYLKRITMKVDNYQRSRIMYTSWEIQRSKKRSRAKALIAAWAIFLNEDIMIYHLMRRHATNRQPSVKSHHLTLFN